MATERKLGRTASQRKAMLRGLTTQLLWYGRIETTETRAKEVRSIADKMITLAVREYDKTVDVEKEIGTALNENVGDRILTIEGMMCEHCEKTVKNALENIDGVKSAVVSHEKNQAIVHLSKEIPDDILASAVEAKDYHVVGIA